MSVDARTEEFAHIELFGKPALFTNGRINRDTVPEGWYCYDFRGSDSDPGKLNYVELHVGVNHSGAVLLPEEIDMKGKDCRRVRGQINFLGEELTIREFCKVHGLECTVKEPQFQIRPARPDEAGICLNAWIGSSMPMAVCEMLWPLKSRKTLRHHRCSSEILQHCPRYPPSTPTSSL